MYYLYQKCFSIPLYSVCGNFIQCSYCNHENLFIHVKTVNDYTKASKQDSSVQFSSVAQSCPTLQPHELQHTRPPCPSPTPGVYSNSCTCIHSPPNLPSIQGHRRGLTTWSLLCAAAAAKLLQSCPTLCNPRTLEWVAISFNIYICCCCC